MGEECQKVFEGVFVNVLKVIGTMELSVFYSTVTCVTVRKIKSVLMAKNANLVAQHAQVRKKWRFRTSIQYIIYCIL